MEKNKLKVKIDLKKGQIINPPDDKIKIIDINKNSKNEIYKIDIGLNLEEEKMSYFIFSDEFKDSKGNSYKGLNDGVSSYRLENNDEEYNNIMHLKLKNTDVNNPITLKIQNYPNIIKKNIKLKIK